MPRGIRKLVSRISPRKRAAMGGARGRPTSAAKRGGAKRAAAPKMAAGYKSKRAAAPKMAAGYKAKKATMLGPKRRGTLGRMSRRSRGRMKY